MTESANRRNDDFPLRLAAIGPRGGLSVLVKGSGGDCFSIAALSSAE